MKKYIIEGTRIIKEKQYKEYVVGSINFMGLYAAQVTFDKKQAKVFDFRNEAVRYRNRVYTTGKVLPLD